MLVRKIPDGSLGIAETVAAIIAFASDPRPEMAPRIRSIALLICRDAGAKTDYERIVAIFNWMRERITYVLDPTNREFVQPPIALLEEAMRGSHMAAGDCDDFASTAGALCSSLGIPVRISLVEDRSNMARGAEPLWAHVYCEALVRKHPKAKEKHWYPIDASLFYLNFGERVLGRTTHIYPGDIDIDLLLDVAQRNQGKGLGYVSEVISKTGPKILEAMRARTTKATMKGPVLMGQSVSGSSGGGLFGLGSAGIAAGLINSILGPGFALTKSAIDASAVKQAARAEAKAAAAVADAQTQLASKYAELEHAGGQLEAERQQRLAAEAAAFDRLRAQAAREKLVQFGVIGVPLVALVILGVVKGRKA